MAAEEKKKDPSALRLVLNSLDPMVNALKDDIKTPEQKNNHETAEKFSNDFKKYAATAKSIIKGKFGVIGSVVKDFKPIMEEANNLLTQEGLFDELSTTKEGTDFLNACKNITEIISIERIKNTLGFLYKPANKAANFEDKLEAVSQLGDNISQKIETLKAEMKETVIQELRQEMRPEVEAEVNAMLAGEMPTPTIPQEPATPTTLKEQLKEELKQEYRDEVKVELQREILTRGEAPKSNEAEIIQKEDQNIEQSLDTQKPAPPPQVDTPNEPAAKNNTQIKPQQQSPVEIAAAKQKPEVDSSAMNQTKPPKKNRGIKGWVGNRLKGKPRKTNKVQPMQDASQEAVLNPLHNDNEPTKESKKQAQPTVATEPKTDVATAVPIVETTKIEPKKEAEKIVDPLAKGALERLITNAETISNKYPSDSPEKQIIDAFKADLQETLNNSETTEALLESVNSNFTKHDDNLKTIEPKALNGFQKSWNKVIDMMGLSDSHKYKVEPSVNQQLYAEKSTQPHEAPSPEEPQNQSRMQI